ncbi:MAG: hypothetical protein ACI9EF_000293 [Pseudohongiellaceae bacterium]|jgi:hypothetical protein
MMIKRERMNGVPCLRWVVLGVAGFLAPAVFAQGVPLPDDAVAYFDPTENALTFCPTTDMTKFPKLNATVDFDTKEQSLDIAFQWTAPGAQTFREVQHFDLGYQPTAVCVRGTAGSILYVAGYVQRTGHVVVEEFTIENLLLGSESDGTSNGTVLLSTVSRTVRREIIGLWADIGPLRGIVYHSTQAKLWLVEELSPLPVWSFDPETGLRTLLFDGSAHPELFDYPGVRRLTVSPNARDGGGFMVVFKPYRVWDRSPSKHEPDDMLFIMRDSDLDGVTDEVAEITFTEFEDVRQYHDYDVFLQVVP